MDTISLQFKELIDKPADFYYLNLLTEEVADYLSLDEKKNIIKRIKTCATDTWNALEADQKKTLSLLPPCFNYTLHNLDNIPFIDAFGVCNPNEQTLLLNQTNIYTLQTILNSYPTLFGDVSVYHIALAHEIFHMLEEQHTNIYTRQVVYTKSSFFHKKTVLVHSASEIGAFHFSMLATGIDFCPYVLALVFDKKKATTP
jgi:hypothetical protein